jgi:cation diffusion facilitator family transporter
MLAEAAHSFADTTNQGFMLVSLRKEAKPATGSHPFGYGKERFFWAFLAAVFIFVSGAIFSIGQGVLQFISPPAEGSSEFITNYAVLVIAFVAEGISWLRAMKQIRGEASGSGKSLFEFVRQSRDPTVKTVLSEDSAALAGLLIAGAGVVLHQVTGEPRFDAGASILIGILLGFVAFALGRDTKGLLLGEAAHPEEKEKIHDIIESHDEVVGIVELLTMAMGPENLLVAARLDLVDGVPSERLEELSHEIDRQLRSEVKGVNQVFLDPTAASEDPKQPSQR